MYNGVFDKPENVILEEQNSEEKRGSKTLVGLTEPFNIPQELEVIDGSMDLDIFEAVKVNIFESEVDKNKDLFHDDFNLCLEAKCEEQHYDSQINQKENKTSNIEILGKELEGNLDLSNEVFFF